MFPEGTPGVSQGVPQELVKGYQAPAEPEPAAQQAQPAEAKPKPKPKPKIVAKPKDESAPTAVTVRPSQASRQSQGPVARSAAAAASGPWRRLAGPGQSSAPDSLARSSQRTLIALIRRQPGIERHPRTSA